MSREAPSVTCWGACTVRARQGVIRGEGSVSLLSDRREGSGPLVPCHHLKPLPSRSPRHDAHALKLWLMVACAMAGRD